MWDGFCSDLSSAILLRPNNPCCPWYMFFGTVFCLVAVFCCNFWSGILALLLFFKASVCSEFFFKASMWSELSLAFLPWTLNNLKPRIFLTNATTVTRHPQEKVLWGNTSEKPLQCRKGKQIDHHHFSQKPVPTLTYKSQTSIWNLKSESRQSEIKRWESVKFQRSQKCESWSVFYCQHFPTSPITRAAVDILLRALLRWGSGLLSAIQTFTQGSLSTECVTVHTKSSLRKHIWKATVDEAGCCLP